jgi:hypothetical protein
MRHLTGNKRHFVINVLTFNITIIFTLLIFSILSNYHPLRGYVTTDVILKKI